MQQQQHTPLRMPSEHSVLGVNHRAVPLGEARNQMLTPEAHLPHKQFTAAQNPVKSVFSAPPRQNLFK